MYYPAVCSICSAKIALKYSGKLFLKGKKKPHALHSQADHGQFLSWPFSYLLKTVNKIRNSSISFIPFLSPLPLNKGYSCKHTKHTQQKDTAKWERSHSIIPSCEVKSHKARTDLSLHLEAWTLPFQMLSRNHFQLYLIQNINTCKSYRQVMINKSLVTVWKLKSIFNTTMTERNEQMKRSLRFIPFLGGSSPLCINSVPGYTISPSLTISFHKPHNPSRVKASC